MATPKSSPFSIHLLRTESGSLFDDKQVSWLLSLLPASYRTESDNLDVASHHVRACIEKELDLERLNKVFGWLWVAGRPMPPRPLHQQLILSRDPMVTEQMDMHLVWTTGRIFLKPIPRFLLEPFFWNRYLSCGRNCPCPTAANAKDTPMCPLQKARKCALGFLFSYVALIRHESDFFIAKEKHLLPKEVNWLDWRIFVEQLGPGHIYQNIDSRFIYGELRLSRLNKIYLLSQRPFLRGYMANWRDYGSFFRDSFTWLASFTVLIAIILTAMQVGLATEFLGNSEVFQSVSYGFTIFSILSPLIAIGLTFLVFFYTFLDNWIATVVYKKGRFHAIEQSQRLE